jgi:hypothetical protein
VDPWEHRRHGFRGRYPPRHSCWDLVNGHTPYLLMIIMLQKP